MIFIEGPRNVGKTYLLDQYLKEFPNKFYTYKFQFFKFYEELNLDKELNAGNYFSFGKDLDLLSLAKANLLPQNILLDRGFVSSIVSAMLFRKAKEEEMLHYIEVIKNLSRDLKIDIVYVEAGEKANRVERDKDSTEVSALNLVNALITDSTFNFKYLWAFQQLENCPGINIRRFTNHFDQESVESFNSLLNSLYQ